MRANVLYFPYIRVPASAWFTRMLLYWDEVASIIPYEYLEDPQRLGEHSRSLIEHELLKQIHPGAYVWQIPSFAEAFGGYLLTAPVQLDKRRDSFRRGNTFRIHMEKLGPIEDTLRDAGVAEEEKYPLFRVERETAADFMAYLAACLGRVEDVDADPVSDERDSLLPFVGAVQRDLEGDTEVSALRWVVLERLFPASERPLGAAEIARFRARHRDGLREFRRRVEREVLDLANLKDPTLRARRMQLFAEEVEDAVDEISARLAESGMGRTVLSKVWSVMLAVPGIPAGLGLVNAVAHAFNGPADAPRPLPLAYAARAQVELLGTPSV